jgi:dUTP pyrophosphatase
MSAHLIVDYFKISSDAHEPVRATDQAACYDVHACFHKQYVKSFDKYNRPVDLDAHHAWKGSPKFVNNIILEPNHRCLIPTGLIFDIPQGYSIRIHPRSGLALKNGITVANCEGVVDSDYYHETFIMLINVSGEKFRIEQGDRIAQLEFHEDSHMSLQQIDTPPGQKTNRQGGFGHTGV